MGRKGLVEDKGLVVKTRTSGEIRSCDEDKDQWGDKDLW